MNVADVLGVAVLAILVGITVILCDRQGQEVRAINDRLAALEDRAYTNIPRIDVSGRTTVYAGSGEITLERIEK